MTFSIDIDGSQINGLQSRIQNQIASIKESLRKRTNEVAHQGVAMLTEYPPEGSGNVPPPPYWDRGTGLVGGQGQILQPSFQYGGNDNKWNYDSYVQGNEAITRASLDEGDVPYAAYLGDPKKQAGFHKRRGWKTTDVVLKQLESADARVVGNELEIIMKL
jgi:hypothetical protein